MYDEPTYEGELNNPLLFQQCKDLIWDFRSFCDETKMNGVVVLTGGDPLLHPRLFAIMKELKKAELSFNIMGNPFLITERTARRLKTAGCDHYQFSLDGLQETHDKFRRLGSFEATMRGISILQGVGMPVNIMMTLSKDNVADLLPLMELCGQLNINAFSFARISAVGMGKQYFAKMFTPTEYRQILLQAEEKREALLAQGSKTFYGEKCHLWSLLNWERGKAETVDDGIVYTGCSIGVTGMIVLADGTVMACRRFPSIVGKIPEQKLLDIFLSKEMDVYRDIDKLEKCSSCALLNYCRGCPAVAYGQTGRHTAPDPQCWA